jgi:DNA-binding IclR family transcriptional regulator
MTTHRVQSVERAVDILMSLSTTPRTLTEVARETALPKGTAFRLLSSLGYQDLVVKAPQGGLYSLGPGFLRASQGVLSGLGVLTYVAKRPLTRLWEETSETVALHVRVGIERVCIEELPSPLPIRYVAEVGASAPLWIGSAGKVLLAAMDPGDVEKVIAAMPLVTRADGSTLDPTALRTEIDGARRRGWAMSAGERIVGAAAVSVPIRWSPAVEASLSILGPANRLTRRRRAELAPALRDTARTVEAQLLDGAEETNGAGSSKR